MSADHLADASMLELFRLDAESQVDQLTTGLLALERNAADREQLDSCMRAAHSLKGAARIVGLTAGVRVAHALEDCFVAAQSQRLTLRKPDIDALLRGVDVLMAIARSSESELEQWNGGRAGDIEACLRLLDGVLTQATGPVQAAGQGSSRAEGQAPAPTLQPAGSGETADRVLRVTAESLNRLLGLAGESRVKTAWVKGFTESYGRVKRQHHDLGLALEQLRDALAESRDSTAVAAALAEVERRHAECERMLVDGLADLDAYDQRSGNLAHRLYTEALACRMRPFGDLLHGVPRLVRDVAGVLGKEVKLEIAGEATPVDRDILGRLEAPLGHLIRNALDHGIELPSERRAAGKPEEGLLRIEAHHSAGRLHISITDDGRGIDPEQLREKVIGRRLIDAAAAAALTEPELMAFLFLPGFTLKESVTDISGRGVGLDAVQDMVKQVRGTVSVSSRKGWTCFQLQLPVTLSVMRVVVAEIGGEPYAFPLAAVARIVRLTRDRIDVLEGRQHFQYDGRRIGLVSAHQIFGTSPPPHDGELPVIVIGDGQHTYGVIVDRLIDQRELVVQQLDPLLGKVKDISAGGLMEDGSPVLIVDTEDLIRSVGKLAHGGGLTHVASESARRASAPRKRVLVVDDSLTVRELERKLLDNRGYDVEVAVDGMDGWNAVRAGTFHLVVTDIDMPRMDGIELVTRINSDPHLKSLPVMIVSYKDRDEDRRRGLDAGAAYYLTKGSFHDDTLVQAVIDLIGEATA